MKVNMKKCDDAWLGAACMPNKNAPDQTNASGLR